MTNTYKKFIYFLPEAPLDEITLPEKKSIEATLKCFKKLDASLKERVNNPFPNIVEIPESFFKYLLTQWAVQQGILETIERTLVFDKLNLKVFCVSQEFVKKMLDVYELALQENMENLTLELNSLVSQLQTLDNFKQTFLKGAGSKK